MRNNVILVMVLLMDMVFSGEQTPRAAASFRSFTGFGQPAYNSYRIPADNYYRYPGYGYYRSPSFYCNRSRSYAYSSPPSANALGYFPWNFVTAPDQRFPTPTILLPAYPAFKEPAFYELPARLNYLPVGAFVNAPGHAFFLEVVPFQNRRVLIPLTGAGGSGD
jgi:hypothetical protein